MSKFISAVKELVLFGLSFSVAMFLMYLPTIAGILFVVWLVRAA